MANSLLVYDVVLKPNTIRFAICDKFFEGAFIPEKKQIILCANTMKNKNDFDNALQR